MKWVVGDWCWHARLATPCRVVDGQEVWGEVTYRIWLPTKDSVIRVRPIELQPLTEIRTTADQIIHTAASAKLMSALEDNLLLAPIQSNVVPLPHQLHALNRAISQDRIRYLLADEVGLGKTIEAGLILRELKLRGLVRRILVVAPKGLVRQWQAEMRQHFNEKLQFIEPAELAGYRQWRTEADQGEESLWRVHDQVICSLDSVKPMDGRRGWTLDQLNTYNRERFEDLIAASWDLVIIDEAHRMGGSTEQVARYKLGAALAETAPYLLLLSATPHQGKTDQFLRLMQLLDRESFPDEASIGRERVHPFVIRTEKRASINAEGQPLFKPRVTRLQAVAWQDRHNAQLRLYEAVTSYVRHGYNQAMASKQRHIGFLMILMQRLVTSSTAAIRTTLERRLESLAIPQAQGSLFENTDPDEWAELDGQSQIDLAITAMGMAKEKLEVQALLQLARETEAAGTDAKAEALLALVYKLQQEENDPSLKVLVFTEFVPTQSMLAGFLESRGFSVVVLNGSMDLEERSLAQQRFAREARVLVSTDAGGEGLNLQFCHVIVNFDMPWNPMRIEQRIGRVDRIGQRHVVRAINFVLHDTVEHRVRQVLENKLAVIAEEFGVDKASDVMDSIESESMFDELFVQSLQDPDSIQKECDAVAAQVREKIAEAKRSSELLSQAHELNSTEAQSRRDHPAQFWLQRAITKGLPTRGGLVSQAGAGWDVKWMNGSESKQACFDARTAEMNPDFEWITLEDPRARAVVGDLPRFVAGQPMAIARIIGLPESISGVWSLWEVNLSAANLEDGFSRKQFLPVFVNDEGRPFVPTAKRIWDLLLTESIEVLESSDPGQSTPWYEMSLAAACLQGEVIHVEMKEEHLARIKDKRMRSNYAFESRMKVISRIGLPAVRDQRRNRLERDYSLDIQRIAEAEICVPDLHALMLLKVGRKSSLIVEVGVPQV
jgi:superfamily II DNA or RNA helicase